jgi:multisubunit Na+/H+ antiporter MnhE subunit
MLHAAAMLFGLFIVWLLTAQPERSAVDITLAAAASAACVIASARFGGVGAQFAHAPRALGLLAARIASVFAGALRTIRAAAAADVTLNPALVRIRTRTAGPGKALLAQTISVTPGMCIVEAGGDAILVHVLNEEAANAAEIAQIEARAAPREVNA